MMREFKEFMSRGNVVDLAVGIIIGGAFGKIVSSLVNDVLMPPIGWLIGGLNFKDLSIKMKAPMIDASGSMTDHVVTLNYGSFIQTAVDFIIIAFAVFMVVKLVNKIKRKEEKNQTEPPKPSNQELLLMEIRDLLKNAK
ncbi:large-conductance mechanosensitive channel protein MscL [bacterium]|nr:large-conductance mechanosensitive channel protein MscL [bacterium]